MKTLLINLLTTALILLIPITLYSQAPRLGTTSSFALFTATGAAFTNVGESTSVTGDAGSHTGSHSVFPTGTLIGNAHWADATSATAAADVLIAYSDLSALICGTVLDATFGGGNTYTPGIYCSGGAAVLNGDIILDAGGNPDALFIFKINGAFSTGLSANVVLINSASGSNVYWQVVGAVSIGGASVFRGTIVASGAISLLEGSSLYGRGLSTAGSIDLHNNIVMLFPAAAGTITGTATVCQGQTGINYLVSAITNATDYIWILPSGASISAGANTNSITVDFSAIAVSGTISVQGTNAAGTGTVSPAYDVTVNPATGSTSFSNGATSICQNAENETYTASASNSSSIGYSVLPAGAGIINPTTGVMNWDAAFSGTATITAISTGLCGTTSAERVVTVTPTVGNPVFSLGGTSIRCQGSGTVTYTATATHTTGITYSLDATSLTGGNSIVSGSGAVTYAAGWSGTSIITASAAGCNGPAATIHTVTTNSSLPASVVIAASENPVCSGTSVTYTAIPTNGGAAPVYQWKVNGSNVGVGSNTYSYVPVNADVVTVVLTSNATCATGSPATSNALTMTVTTDLVVSVAVAASENPVCAGTSVTFTATPTNGGAAPVYQWKVNGVNAGTGGTTYSYVPVNADVVTVVLTSNATCATGSPATSNALSMTVTTDLVVSVAIVASENPVCAGTSVTFTATPTNGGAAPVYQWEVNGVNAGTGGTTYSYIPVNGDQVAVVLTSSILCAVSNTVTSLTLTLTVNPALPVSVSITASENPVCEGTSVTFTATPTNGGAAPVYQWKVNGANVGIGGTTYSYIPVNGDQVAVVLTSSIVCAVSNTVTSPTLTLMVNPSLPVSVLIAASENPVCAGTSVTYTATPTNGGAAPVYQWKVNGSNVGVGSNTYSYVPVNADVVIVVLTSNATCATGSPATSNAVTMTVSADLPVSVSIAASENPVCAGTSVTYTATPTNGGAAPVYQWKVNGSNVGVGSNTYSYVPVNADVVTVVLTSNATCATGSPATSNAVTMTVSANLPVSVSIAPSENPVCSGTTVTFTATPTNGGAAPVYQWKVNGGNVGTGGTTYSYIPVTGDIITAVLTSNATCATGSPATSNALTMSVVAELPVSVAIAASENPVCAGTSVTFTASPTNGGAAPVYQWKVNGGNVGTGGTTYSYIPVTGDIITAVLTSNATCATGSPATSNALTMSVVAELPVSVAIAASENPVCSGTSVTFTASPTNGGAAPVYQWKVNGINVGTGGTTYSYIPVTGDIITSVLTSNATCATGSPATSNALTMTVTTDLVVSVAVVASENPVCAGTSVTFTATPTNGGAAPVYQWKVNGVNAGTGGTTYSYIPVNGDQVAVVLTSSIVCAVSNTVTSPALTLTVNPTLPVSVAIAASENPVCSGTSVTFTATPTNGGAAPVYQWKVNGVNAGTGGTTYSYIPVTGDIITAVLTSNATCATGSPATSNALTMTVTTDLVVSVAVVASENPVCAGTSVTFMATPTNGGAAPVYQWKVNGVNAGTGGTTYSYIPVNGDQVAVVLTSSIVCAVSNTVTSPALTLTVNPTLPVSVLIAASENPVCSGTSVTFTATPTHGGAAPVYQWKVNGVNAGTGGTTYSYIPVTGDIITTVLTSNATCATGSPATSNALTMTVTTDLVVSVAIVASENPVCAGTSVTFTATPTNGGAAPVYQWKVNGSNVGAGSNTYSYVPVNADVVTVVLTSNATCATGSPATSNAVTMTVSADLPVSVSIAPSENPVCAGTSVTFTATPTNGGAAPVYQWKVNGSNVGVGSNIYSYVPVNADVVTVVLTSNATCATGSPATSNVVTMTVSADLPVSVSIAASENPVCAGTSVTFTATPVNGGAAPVYQWKVNGVNAGTGGTTYSYIPLTDDIITTVLTSNATCATGSPATSNALTMTVTTDLVVSVAVVASENPVCAGTSVTFTATPTNGGAAPVYQWKVNGVNAGTGGTTYSYIPVNGDQVAVVLTSSIVCAVSNTVTSPTLTLTVNPTLPVSVVIAASENPVCSGTSVTFTATPTNGGAAPVYQWKVNDVNAGTGGTTYSYIPLTGDIITTVLTSNATCATGSPATSNALTMTVNPTLPVSVLIAASENPVCSGTSVTFTATPTHGGAAPVYQWKVNGVNAGTGGTTYSYIPVNGDQVAVVLTSSIVCAVSNTVTSPALTLTVNPTFPVSVLIAASENPVCSGTSVTFTATPTNGGAAPVYQWKVNGVNAGTGGTTYSYIPVTGDIITTVLTSNATCATGSPATSNALTMTVTTDLVVSMAVVASENPVCAGTSVTFTATPTNGGAAPVYQWKVNGVNAGTGGTTYSYIPVNGDQVAVVLTSSIVCAVSNTVTSPTLTLTVNPTLPVSVVIAASENPVTSGTSVTFTGTPTNGGVAPTYQWKVNGANVGTGGITYSYIPVNGDQVSMVLTSSMGCTSGSPATSNTISLIVNSLPIILAGADWTICSDCTYLISGSTASNAGSLVWTTSGTGTFDNANILHPVYTPGNSDILNGSVILTLTATPEAPNPVIHDYMVLSFNQIAVVNAGPDVTICAGSSFTISTASAQNAVSIRWTHNGTGILIGATTLTPTYIPGTSETGSVTLSLTATSALPCDNATDQMVITITPCNRSGFQIIKKVTETTFSAVGNILHYSIEIVNTSQESIYTISVTDPNAVFTTRSPIGILEKGSTRTILAAHTVTQADIDAGLVINCAFASGSYADGVPVSGSSPCVTSIGVQRPQVTATKFATETAFHAAGDSIHYSIEVFNCGTVTLSNLTVTDPRVSFTQGNLIASLPPATTQAVNALYVVTPADITAGRIANIAIVSGFDPNGVPISIPSNELILYTNDQERTLSVSKIALENRFVAVGEILHYEITVTNYKNINLLQVFVTDSLSVITEGSPIVRLNIGNSVTLNATHVITQADLDAGRVVSRATASTTDNWLFKQTAVSNELTVFAIQSPGLLLLTTAEEPTYSAVGERISFTHGITNNGNVKISGIKLSDPQVIQNGTISIADLNPGEYVSVKTSYSITQSDLDVGTLEQTARISGFDQNNRLIQSSGNSLIIPGTQKANLSTTLTAAEIGFSMIGDVIHYNLQACNTGNVTLTHLMMTSGLSQGTTIAELLPGAMIVFNAEHSITAYDLAAGRLVHVATIHAIDRNGKEISWISNELTILPNNVSVLSISTTAAETTYGSAGETLHYTLTLKNNSSATYFNLVVSDPKTVISGNPAIALLTPGSLVTLAATHETTQVDLDAGLIFSRPSITGIDSDGSTFIGLSNPVTVFAHKKPGLTTMVEASETGFNSAGDQIHYTVVVKNTGNQSLTGITFADQGILTFSGIPAQNLAPGESAVLTAVYTTTLADLDAGKLVQSFNSFAWAPDQQFVVASSNEISVPAMQNPELSTTAQAAESTFSKVGEWIHYTIRVENTGNVTLISTAVKDPNAVIITARPITTMLPGESALIEASHLITQSDMDAGLVVSAATAEGFDLKGNTIQKKGNTITVIGQQQPELSAVTAASASSYRNEGDVILYSVVVTNTGNVRMNDITISYEPSTLDIGKSFASLAPGESASVAVEYRVTVADVIAGKIVTPGLACGYTLNAQKFTFVSNEITVRLIVENYNLTNFPNPFSYETTIMFDLPEKGTVILKIYDITGREVGQIDQRQYNEGRNFILWKTPNTNKGLYILKMYYKGEQAIKRMSRIN